MTAKWHRSVALGTAGHIHVDDGGAGGIPVVFVHSFAGSGAHWTRQLAHLGVRCAAPWPSTCAATASRTRP